MRSPPIQTLGLKDGLGSNRVSCVMQDHQGFLWIATWFGLHRYDGYQFDTWQHTPGDPSTLSGNLVYWVIEDQQHRIWVGCYEGLNLLDPLTGEITQFLHDPKDPKSLSDNRVEHVYEDSDANIWICTQAGNLNLFNEQDSTFQHWRARAADTYDLRMFLVKEDPRDPNVLWAGCDQEVYRFDKTAKAFTLIGPPNLRGIPATQVFDLEFEGDSLLWIASWGNSILKYDLRTDSTTTFHYYNEADRAAGKWEVVMTLEPRGEDEFWFVSKLGPGIFHKRTGEFRFFTRELARQGVPMDIGSSRALCIDRAGICWSGSFGGLRKVDENTHRFLYYPLEASNSNIITRFVVTDVVEDRKGKELYVSTQNGDGLYVIDLETEDYFSPPLIPDTFQNHHFPHFYDDMLLDRRDRLLILSINVLMVYNPESRQVERYFTRPDLQAIYSSFYPFNFVEDEKGNLWFASLRNGIMKYDLARDTLLIYQHDPENANSLIHNDDIYELRPGPNGNLWVSTRIGISCLNPETETFKNYRLKLGGQDSLYASYLREMDFDDAGHLWIGTMFEGLYRFDPEKGADQQVFNLNQGNGLPHNTVQSVRKDRQGNIWTISERGLSIITPSTLAIQNFGEADGLIRFRTGMAVHAGESGHMYIGARRGFLRTHPEELLPNAYLPPIFLRNFQVNGQPIDQKTDINAQDTLYLAADENFFSFEMAALNYSNSDQNQYAYQLEGLNPDWVQAGNRRFVSFSNLSGGWYRLRMKGSNNDGVWNPEEKVLHLYVAYPWYQQSWFLILCGLLAIGLVVLIIRLRSQQVRKQEQLKVEFSQQLQEVEMVALRAQMNPHFLFNCLNCINRFIVRNDQQKASEYLSDFAVLIRMILNHSQEDQIQLGDELKALKLYIQMESLRFEERFDFEIIVGPEVEQDFARVPPLILQPYVENAIWHGLMQKPEKGHLRILISQQEDYLCCLIEDDGVGRKKAEELKSKSATLHKSMGMTITSFRLKAMGRLRGAQGTVEVVDLKDAAGQATGTRVILKIPV